MSAPEPKDEFHSQILKCDKANRALEKERQQLEDRLKRAGDQTDSSLQQQKLEYLKGAILSYKAVNHVFKLMAMSIDNRYEDLMASNEGEGQPELDELKSIFEKMTHLLFIYEENMLKLVGSPHSFFQRQIAQFQKWYPGFASVGVPCAFAAGVTYLIIQLTGIPLAGIFSVLTPLTIGAGFACIVCLALAWFINGEYSVTPIDNEESKSELEKIAMIVEEMKAAQNNTQFLKQLDEIIATATSVAAELPGHADWKCLLCHKEGENMVEPVKAQSCRFHHYVCKPCWKEYIKTEHGIRACGKCMICEP